MRQEITQRHVRVGVLEPGAVDTELVSHNTETSQADIADFLADKEILTADDVADGVVYMVTRPRRTSISELWTMPTDQA